MSAAPSPLLWSSAGVPPRMPPPGLDPADLPPLGEAPLTAMIVEDEMFVAWALQGMLEDLGYGVQDVCSNSVTALDAIRRAAPDFLLMDVNLGGGLDGIATAAAIRATFPAPVVFVSAYADADTRARIDAGVPGALLLTKPIAVAELQNALDAVRRMLRDRRH